MEALVVIKREHLEFVVSGHSSTLEDEKSPAVVRYFWEKDRFVIGDPMKIAGSQDQVFGRTVVDLKAPAHAACVSQGSSFHIHELARAIEYRLAIACVSCDYAPGEAGLRIDSQSASINQLVIIIKIFRLEVSSR